MARTEPLLTTKDVVTSKDFYELLGFELKNSWEPDGKLSWCLMEYDNAPLMLEQASNPASFAIGQDVSIYVVCDDVDPIVKTWQARGVKISEIHDAFYGMRQVFVKDPDGRTICFESQIRD